MKEPNALSPGPVARGTIMKATLILTQGCSASDAKL